MGEQLKKKDKLKNINIFALLEGCLFKIMFICLTQIQINNQGMRKAQNAYSEDYYYLELFVGLF